MQVSDQLEAVAILLSVKRAQCLLNRILGGERKTYLLDVQTAT
jgi:hypothetical protein